jgi:hypothetical protein
MSLQKGVLQSFKYKLIIAGFRYLGKMQQTGCLKVSFHLSLKGYSLNKKSVYYYFQKRRRRNIAKVGLLTHPD